MASAAVDLDVKRMGLEMGRSLRIGWGSAPAVVAVPWLCYTARNGLTLPSRGVEFIDSL